MKTRDHFAWSNWAGNHSCIAKKFFEPQSEEEVCEIVQLARREGRRVRVAGAGHSFSPLVPGNDFLVSFEKFPKKISVDGMLVTCSAGIRLCELYSLLQENNLSLPNYGVINKQYLAGALATGTHGSSKKHKSLSACIESIRLVLSNGEVKIIDRRSELWDASSISLGMLGIVTEITLRCEPMYFLRSNESVVSLEDYLQNMDLLAGRFEYFKAWWFPHTGKVYLFEAERVGSEIYAQRSTLEQYNAEQRRRDAGIDQETAPFFIKSLHEPTLIPGINQHALDHYFTPRTRIGTSMSILVHDETVPMVVSEYALPLHHDAHKAALIEFIDRIEKNNFLHFPVDLRYTAAESSWLSPSYNRDSFYIGMCVREYREKNIPGVMQVFCDIMRKHKARPNWGKIFDLEHDELLQLFPRMKDFAGVKNKLDPPNTFGNEHMDKWFGG
jgi:L-gulonolactone oxidase